MAERLSIVDPVMAERLSIVDPVMAERLSIVDPVMAERLSIVDPVMAERLSAEWLQAEQRMAMAADPMVRLQMAGLHQSAAVAAAAAAAHTHTHAHAHTHLHLHQPDPALGVPLGLGPQTPGGREGNLFLQWRIPGGDAPGACHPPSRTQFCLRFFTLQ